MTPRAKLILTTAAIVSLTFIISWYFTPVYMEIMVGRLAKTQYQDDYIWAHGLQSPSLYFLIFSIIACGCNFIALIIKRRLTISGIWILGAIDQAVLPVSIFWMILYNNLETGMPGFNIGIKYPNLMSLLDPIVIAGVLLFKHLMIYKIVRKPGEGEISPLTKLVSVLYFIIFFVWSFVISMPGPRKEECFDRLYGKYISYHTFEWVEFIYILGGGVISFALITIIFKKIPAYLVFLLLSVGIILMRWNAFASCR